MPAHSPFFCGITYAHAPARLSSYFVSGILQPREKSERGRFPSDGCYCAGPRIQKKGSTKNDIENHCRGGDCISTCPSIYLAFFLLASLLMALTRRGRESQGLEWGRRALVSASREPPGQALMTERLAASSLRKTRRSEGLVKVEMTGGRAVGCPVSAVRVPGAAIFAHSRRQSAGA